MADVPYQIRGLLAQLKAERENAVALGLVDRVAAVDKQLRNLRESLTAGEARKNSMEAREAPPVGRSTKRDAQGSTA